jgi:penicillin-binding protein 1A
LKANLFPDNVKYDDISPNIINAFVALEEKRYFKHHGIDYYRSAGAVINNIKAGYKKEAAQPSPNSLPKHHAVKRKDYNAQN